MSVDSIFLINLNSGYLHPQMPYLIFTSDIIVKKNYKSVNLTKVANDFFIEYKKTKSTRVQQYPLIEIGDRLCAYIITADIVFLLIYSTEVQLCVIVVYLLGTNTYHISISL